MLSEARSQNDKDQYMRAGPGRCVDARPASADRPGEARVRLRAARLIRCAVRRFAACAALLLGLASAAHALSVGELEVRSGLGQPFWATLRYVTPRGSDVHPLCIRANSIGYTGAPGTSVPPNNGVPFLPDPRFDVEPGAGGGVINIRTARLVGEPLMRINLMINCGPSVTLNREFSIILDPPRADAPLAAQAAAPAASAASSAAAAAPPATSPIVRRPRRPVQSAAAPAAVPAAALPYEPGVTPPPGRRGVGGAVRAREQAQPQYRLTLSRPGDDLPANPSLRSSDTLTMPSAGVTAEQRDALREEWRLRQAGDPVVQARSMNDQLAKLDRGLADVIKQVSSLKDERDKAQARVRQLEEEKQQLSAWLNGLALALGFIGCVALAAVAFWTYRRRIERRRHPYGHLFDAPLRPTPPAEAPPDEQFDAPPWRPEAAEPPARPRRPLMRPTPPAPPEAAPHSAVAPAPEPRPAQRVTELPSDTDAPTRSYTATVELPKSAATPGSNVHFAAMPPTPPVPMPTPPAPAVAAHEETQTVELPDIAFDLPPMDGSGEKTTDMGFTIDFEEPPAAPAPEAQAAAAPPAATPVTYMPPAPARAPTPTQPGMGILMEDIAAVPETPAPAPGASVPDFDDASLAPDAPGAAEKADTPAAGLTRTGSHRTLDIDLGVDDDSEMRAQLYRQEFELKLFPEIVHGQAKLKVPQSVISLARTYYQEDFDTNRAVNLLEYAADRTPDPQRVRLALLEILRMEGMAREYVAVARVFHRQFPGAEEWETVSAYGHLLAPEEALFAEADATGYDLNMPSMWLGSTLDMTRYVLAQDLHDAMHGPLGEPA